MLTLDNFESAINATIVQRGYEYFKNQAVESLEEGNSGTWTATVEGTEDYEVEVVLSGRKITDQSCDCPYDGGPVCKHVVAVLYALREQWTKPITKSPKTGKLTFEALLLKTNLDELRQFILHQKQQDRSFGEKFMLFFAEKDPKLDVSSKYEGLVRQIIRNNSNRGFMDYRQTSSFSKEIKSVIQAAETALAQKNYRDAMCIAKVICKETMLLTQNCDDSSGYIGGVLFSSVYIFKGIAEATGVSPELLDQLLDYIEKAFTDKYWFDYGDFGYELLDVAEKTALRTNPERYLHLLDSLAKIHVGKYSDYKQENFKKRKIRFYEQIGSPEEAEKLIAANIEIVEVRQGEVQKAIQKKDFARAKQLIAEGIQIAEGKKHPGTVNQWEAVLLDIARLENDVATARYFTKKFAFDRGINVNYYQAWKATFAAAEWAAVIEQHIQSVITEEKSRPRKAVWDTLEHSLYSRLAPVFIQEEQWARLLEVVSNTYSESVLSAVHPHLSKRYPAEMLAMYLVVLEKLGNEASNRKEYEHVAALMKSVKKDIEGSHTAINKLATELMEKYPRRPAMVEALEHVIRR